MGDLPVFWIYTILVCNQLHTGLLSILPTAVSEKEYLPRSSGSALKLGQNMAEI